MAGAAAGDVDALVGVVVAGAFPQQVHGRCWVLMLSSCERECFRPGRFSQCGLVSGQVARGHNDADLAGANLDANLGSNSRGNLGCRSGTLRNGLSGVNRAGPGDTTRRRGSAPRHPAMDPLSEMSAFAASIEVRLSHASVHFCLCLSRSKERRNGRRRGAEPGRGAFCYGNFGCARQTGARATLRVPVVEPRRLHGGGHFKFPCGVAALNIRKCRRRWRKARGNVECLVGYSKHVYWVDESLAPCRPRRNASLLSGHFAPFRKVVGHKDWLLPTAGTAPRIFACGPLSVLRMRAALAVALGLPLADVGALLSRLGQPPLDAATYREIDRDGLGVSLQELQAELRHRLGPGGPGSENELKSGGSEPVEFGSRLAETEDDADKSDSPVDARGSASFARVRAALSQARSAAGGGPLRFVWAGKTQAARQAEVAQTKRAVLAQLKVLENLAGPRADAERRAADPLLRQKLLAELHHATPSTESREGRLPRGAPAVGQERAGRLPCFVPSPRSVPCAWSCAQTGRVHCSAVFSIWASASPLCVVVPCGFLVECF